MLLRLRDISFSLPQGSKGGLAVLAAGNGERLDEARVDEGIHGSDKLRAESFCNGVEH